MNRFLVIVLMIVLGAFGAKSQESKILSSWEYMNVYRAEKANGNNRVAIDNLLLAKTSIDDACANEKTAMKSKAWKRKVDVYFALLVDTAKELTPYKLTAVPAMIEAAQKARSVEPGKVFEEKELNRSMDFLASLVFKAGYTAFEQKMYDAAFQSFELCHNIKKDLGIMDTVSLNNMFLAAYSGKKYDKALELGNQLKKIGAADPIMYRSLSQIYTEKGDTLAGLEIIKEARSKFPQKSEFITEELNFYLMTKNNAAAAKSLSEAIEAFKDDKTMLKNLYFNAGVIYSQMGDKSKAFDNYNKCLEVDPNYSGALNNIASFYVDEGNEFIKQANNLPLNETKKYDDLKSKAKEKYKIAADYLERVYKTYTDENQKNKLKTTLKELYIKVGDEEKVLEYSK